MKRVLADEVVGTVGAAKTEHSGFVSHLDRLRRQLFGQADWEREVANRMTDQIGELCVGVDDFTPQSFAAGDLGKVDVRATVQSDLDPGIGHFANLLDRINGQWAARLKIVVERLAGQDVLQRNKIGTRNSVSHQQMDREITVFCISVIKRNADRRTITTSRSASVLNLDQRNEVEVLPAIIDMTLKSCTSNRSVIRMGVRNAVIEDCRNRGATSRRHFRHHATTPRTGQS